jgi:sulfatase modifying factor 1
MPQPRRRPIAALALGVGLAVGLVLGLEGLARGLEPSRVPDTAPSPDGATVLGPNPYLLWEHSPGARQEQGVTVHINSLGLRGPEPAIPKPPGLRRILATGDSSVYGFGVPLEDSFVAVAAAAMASPEAPVEGIPAALPGYSTLQTLNLLGMRALRLEPDLVVVANLWSDHASARVEDAALLDRYQRFDAGLAGSLDRALRRTALYRLLSWELGVRRGAQARARMDWTPEPPSSTQQGRRVPVEDYRHNLAAIARLVGERGAELAYLVLPHPADLRGQPEEREGYHPYRQAMRAEAARLGAPIVEGGQVFAAASHGAGPEIEDLFLDNIHPSAAGHRLLGRALADALGVAAPELADAPSVTLPPGDMVLVPGGGVVDPTGSVVELAPFLLDRHPVREAEFQAWSPRHSNPWGAGDDLPAVGLSWEQARGYCQARGARLPTDAEWQRALAGAEQRSFPWGEAWEAGGLGDLPLRPRPVGAHPAGASPEGLEDLTGNVFHWAHSRYQPPADAPAAPEMRGELRLLRGSCCGFLQAWARSDHRAAMPANGSSAWVGFRCARAEQPGDDPNLTADARWVVPREAMDEGEAVRQLVSELFGPGRLPTAPEVLEAVATLEPGAIVADIGCGLGAVSLQLAERVGTEGTIWAVDLDPEVLAFVERAANERGLDQIETQQASSDGLGLAPGCCDALLLYDMVNSLRAEDLPPFAASVARSLAPGGSAWVYQTPGGPRPSPALEAFEAAGLEIARSVSTRPGASGEPGAELLWELRSAR